ncbi:Flavin-containing monooxygenase FMO GS-OX-like 9 [Abeliophyllum distichum]|uniref:Flavin-containing monooxygenase n=1 Tax=Abeliophyllum distichum TaxID=126358 RepID=A0ABD1RXM4_9LAMI
MVSSINMSKNVCVIGGGPSGLVAARELRKEGHNVVVFEQNHDVGGQWLYDPIVENEDPLGRDNFLKGKDLRWVVKTTAKTAMDKVVEEVYDAVVVATGHYSKPRLPKIKGMDAWRRRQIHSHIYRVPEPFRNEVVLVVGNSLSGQDISMELVDVAKEIHLSAKSLDISEGLIKVISKYDNLYLHPQIDSLHEDGRVLFIDGSWLIANTIIYCTGYSYSFPFLDTKGIVVVDDDRVGPLYEHTFPPSLAPSLSFIGIPRKLIGFPFFECQAKWISQLLSGKKTLPSWDEMMQSIEKFYHSTDVAGIPKHNTHDLANFEYCDKYADYIGFPHLEEWRKELCLSALRSSDVNLETYRDSYEDKEMLQEARKSPHFTQLGTEAFAP